MFPEIAERITRLCHAFRVWRALRFYKVDVIYIYDSVIQSAREIR